MRPSTASRRWMRPSGASWRRGVSAPGPSVCSRSFAFGLACIGLFGVVALDVGSRRHELAVRLAVGARRVDLLRCVLVPAARKVLIGAALGAAARIVGARAIGSLLFGVRSTDPITYAAVIVLVLIVVAVASYVPRAPSSADRSSKIVDAAVTSDIFVATRLGSSFAVTQPCAKMRTSRQFRRERSRTIVVDGVVSARSRASR